MIHVIGDSHASVFTGLHGLAPIHPRRAVQALPGFRVHHLGPCLAYSVTRSGHRVQRLIREVVASIKPDDSLLFHFGEIDCRNHVVRHAPRPGAIAAFARALAQRYVAVVRRLVGSRRSRVGFVALPPAADANINNPFHPIVGTFLQRRRAVEAFNRGLQDSASNGDILCLNAYSHLCTSRRGPKPRYFADGVHADPRALGRLLSPLIAAGWVETHSPTIHAARALSSVPPPDRASLNLPGGLDKPGEAQRILLSHALNRCRLLGARRIAVYGGGQHTRRLGRRAFEGPGLRVCAILDDSPKTATMMGVPVMRPADPRLDADAVIISSDGHEDVLLAKARGLLGARNIPVVPIYAWNT